MANDFISQITLPDNQTYDIKDNMAVRGNARIFYGTCSDAVAAKTVTCAAYDSLQDGDILFVNFSQVNTGAVGSITLNVNGTGARNVKYLNNANDPANIPGVGYIRAATYMFRYKLGTSNTNSYWIIDIQYNSTGSDTVTRQQIDTSRTGKYSLLQASMVIGTATNTSAYSTYRSDNIYAEPSTGIIYATEFSGNVAWNNITDKPFYTAATNPTLTTRLNYDGYFYATKLYSGGAEVLTSYTETDPTVPSWAKASTKPSYTANEVGALPSSTVVNKVKQSSNSSSAAYKVLFGTTASPTSGNDYETYYGSLTYNPNTKALVTGGTVDGYTLAAAAAKGVVTSVDTSANLPTANAVKTFVENKGYVTSSGVTQVSTGAGLTGGDITTTGTIKANLTSETKLTNAAADGTETSGRVYPVRLDKNGKLAVNVPWTNVNSDYLPLAGGNMTGNINRYYSATSNEPMLKLSANDANASLFQIGHGTAVGSVSGNYYILRYIGAQNTPDNELQLISAVSSSTEKIAIKINENGIISFPQMNIGNSTKPVYFNAGVFTEGTTYAGGTAVTLNESGKGGTTASFYAPTAVGTSGYVLKSQGSGAPEWEQEYSVEILDIRP